MQRQSDRAAKRELIKSILNGSFDITQFIAPRGFIVYAYEKDNRYEVFEGESCKGIMNKEEYEQWQSTLRPQDWIFICLFDDYAYEAPAPVKPSKKKRAKETPAETPRPRNEAANAVKNDIEITSPQIEIESEVFVMPLGGKVSQYGDKWRLDKRRFN